MRTRTLLSLASALLLPALAVATAHSQVRPSLSSAPHVGDIYAGALATGSNPSLSNYSWTGGLDLTLAPWLTGTGEVSVAPSSFYSGFNKLVVTDYFVGPRLFLPASISPHIHPYADALIGLENVNNTRTDHTSPVANANSLTWAVDGGADFRLMRFLYLRPQVGFLHSSFKSNFTSPSSSVGSGRWRIGAFLVYRF